MCTIRLVDITKENWEYVVGLTTNENLIPTISEKYVMSNAYSMLQAVYDKKWNAKIIVLCDDYKEKPIGFAMYGPTELNGQKVHELCRFMIDIRFQGNGYGIKALNEIVKEMERTYGCDAIYLSVVPENEKAQHIYKKSGFVSTGITVDNGINSEIIYVLRLDPE